MLKTRSHLLKTTKSDDRMDKEIRANVLACNTFRSLPLVERRNLNHSVKVSFPAVKHCEMVFFVCLFFNVSMLSESEQVHVVWLSFCGPDKTKKKSHRHRHFELLMFNSKASQPHTHENFMKQQVFVF